MKKQNKKIFYYRDLLEKHLKKKELELLLDHNNQEIPPGQVSAQKITVSLLSINIFGLLDFGTGIKRLMMWRIGSKEDAEPAGIPPICVKFRGWPA